MAPVEAGAHLPALDGIRGLAILLVMVFHFVPLAGIGTSPVADLIVIKASGMGWAGVDLFFVLSGFLITGILYDSKSGKDRYFRNFYFRRVLRIFPLYYGFLLFMIVLLPLVQPMEKDISRSISHDWFWYAAYITNVRGLFEPAGFRLDSLFVGHLWSLAVEEQFYLVWPLVVLLFRRRLLMAICAAAIVGALALRAGLMWGGMTQDVPYSFTPARIDTLAMGAFLALAARDAGDWRQVARWRWPAAVAAGGVLIGLFISRGDLTPPFVTAELTLGFSATTLLFGALLVAAITSPPKALAHNVFTNRAMTALGRYSYAAYLFHLPIASILLRRTDLESSLPTVLGSSLPSTAVYSLAAGGLTIAAAWLSWHLFEKQTLKLKSRFPYSWSERPSARAQIEPLRRPSLSPQPRLAPAGDVQTALHPPTQPTS